MPSYAVFGINHHSAGLNLREKASFLDDQIVPFLKLLKNIGILECAILSTCNRVEIYAAVSCHETAKRLIKQSLLLERSSLTENDLASFYYHQDESAVRHLFGVISGMDSMILGELQIIAQVKHAYKLASNADTTGKYLHKLFQQSFQCAKQIQSQTNLSKGAGSVASAAVQWIYKKNTTLVNKSALILGSGKTGRLVGQLLKKKGIGTINIVSRTLANASSLANELGGSAYTLDDLPSLIETNSIVIAASSSESYLIKSTDLQSSNLTSSSFIVDLAVPRNIEPSIALSSQVEFIDLDSLKHEVEQTLKLRENDLQSAEDILNSHVCKLNKWRENQLYQPLIISLQDKLETIRSGELEKLSGRVTPETQMLLDQVTTSLVKKILHLPLRTLNANVKGQSDSPMQMEALKTLFELVPADEV